VSLGFVHDRRLMREAQVNLAIRWFIGYALHEALPDHSSLTRIRQRWGEDVFRRVFVRVVQQCRLAGLVSTETVRIDASLIRANVSMDARVARHLDAVEKANNTERDARTSGAFKKLCRTDPDASCQRLRHRFEKPLATATSSKAPLRPTCKQHTAVDDQEGVVVDVTPQACLRHDEIVTGEQHDTGRFEERLDAIEDTVGAPPDRITADTIHGVGRVYAALERRQIEAVIPPLRTTRRRGAKGFATGRFKFDPHHDVVRCPAKKRLKPRNSTKSGKWYRADRRDCARCPLKAQCLPQGVPSRRVHIVANHATILRARRNRTAWGDEEHAIYSRHRWRVEGTHGTAKTLHGLNRAIRRGLENTKIQALLTAIAMNLKKSAIATFLIHRTPAGRCARWTPLPVSTPVENWPISPV
jgi:IS5 family transposase